MVLRGEKQKAWESHVACPGGGQKRFLSNSFWEG